jgi:hypothetical protein
MRARGSRADLTRRRAGMTVVRPPVYPGALPRMLVYELVKETRFYLPFLVFLGYSRLENWRIVQYHRTHIPSHKHENVDYNCQINCLLGKGGLGTKTWITKS